MTKTEAERLTRLETIYENQSIILNKMGKTLEKMEETLIAYGKRETELNGLRERIAKIEKIIDNANKLLWATIFLAIISLVITKGQV